MYFSLENCFTVLRWSSVCLGTTRPLKNLKVFESKSFGNRNFVCLHSYVIRKQNLRTIFPCIAIVSVEIHSVQWSSQAVSLLSTRTSEREFAGKFAQHGTLHSSGSSRSPHEPLPMQQMVGRAKCTNKTLAENLFSFAKKKIPSTRLFARRTSKSFNSPS